MTTTSDERVVYAIVNEDGILLDGYFELNLGWIATHHPGARVIETDLDGFHAVWDMRDKRWPDVVQDDFNI